MDKAGELSGYCRPDPALAPKKMTRALIIGLAQATWKGSS